jgi:putative component of membrane protein insertase Oxa1/YidC/SpoIIIJ protein YidD
MERLIRYLILKLIHFYQKFISPVKGFKCAYGVLHRDGTCSGRISEIVRVSPFVKMPFQISLQFKRCATASKMLENDRPNRKDTDECNDKLCCAGEWGCLLGV